MDDFTVGAAYDFHLVKDGKPFTTSARVIRYEHPLVTLEGSQPFDLIIPPTWQGDTYGIQVLDGTPEEVIDITSPDFIRASRIV